jgi:hypothetical protein
MSEVLADTGALFALLDTADACHDACAEAFERLPLPLVTTHAVLTELFYLVGSRPDRAAATWRFVRSGALRVEPLGESDLAGLEALMKRYADRPMDYADASLVQLADRLGITTVFTVDRGDFETYRQRGRKPFHVVPG